MKHELANKPANIQKNLKQKDLKDNQFYLASLWKVLFARLFDLILMTLPFIIFSLILKDVAKTNNWYFLLINFFIALIINFVYFAVMPYFMKGQTLGKLVFKIKPLKRKLPNQILFREILFREFYLIIGPWLIISLINILFLWFAFKYNQNPDSNKKYLQIGYVIYQLNWLLFLAWFLILGVSIKLQKNHQSIVDIKLDILIVEVKHKQIKQDIIKAQTTLKVTPGVFEKENLRVISNSEEQELDLSISLEKPKLTENLQISVENKKQIENKGDKSE